MDAFYVRCRPEKCDAIPLAQLHAKAVRVDPLIQIA